MSILSISKDFLGLGYVETQVFVQITLNEDATTAAISRKKGVWEKEINANVKGLENQEPLEKKRAMSLDGL